MGKGFKFSFLLCFCCLLPFLGLAKIKLPALFSDNMVLQQQSSALVWGWASPGEMITVKGSWNNQLVQAETLPDGQWKLKIQTPKAGGPYTLTIGGEQAIILHNVMIGEVWICSGQSNMEMPVKGWVGAPVLHSKETIQSSNNSFIRLFKVKRKVAFYPQENCEGNWVICNPETVANFSATAYFFGKELYDKLKIPIGLIQTAWGGTVAEAWTSKDGLKELISFEDGLRKIDSIQANFEEIESKEDAYNTSWEKNKGKINKAYLSNQLNTNEWKEMQLPQNWEQVGYPELDGVVWFRKTIRIPKSWTGNQLKLELGSIDDADITWFNGQKVGSGYGWQTPRSYLVPAQLVLEGENVIVVKVIDESGGGGIHGDPEVLKIYREDQTPKQGFSLSGNWKFKIGLVKRQVKELKNPNLPTVLFNGMIHPLIPFGIRGVIWYQGESNVGRASQYAKLFPALIQDWRGKWGQGNFPFYFVQIAPYPYGGNRTAGAALRDAQRKSLDVPRTGMVVTLDIGDTTNIHPANKKDVGYRLSLWALNKVYDKKDIVFSGPLYDKMKIKGNKVIVSFLYAHDGLVTKEGDLNHFAIAGVDGKFVRANAEIKGSQIILYSEKINHPRAIRFGWGDTVVPHLFNKAGLPASSFQANLMKE